MLKFGLAALLLIAAPSFAMAGGGGANTKSTGTIRIINDDQNEVVGVLINPSESVLEELDEDPSPERFQELGGRLVNPGQSIRITKVKAGSQRVVYFYEDSLELLETSVNVTKGRTTTLRIPNQNQTF